MLSLYLYSSQAIVAFKVVLTSFRCTKEGTYVKTVYSRLDVCLYDGQFNQSWEGNQDRVFMQAPPSLQALIIPDLRVSVYLCKMHCMATQD